MIREWPRGGKQGSGEPGMDGAGRSGSERAGILWAVKESIPSYSGVSKHFMGRSEGGVGNAFVSIRDGGKAWLMKLTGEGG